MPTIDSGEAEASGLLRVAELMAVAARTAPKTRGVDEIATAILGGAEKDALADEMVRLGGLKRNPLPFFERDAGSLRESPLVILIGVRGTTPKRPENPLNCGACGFETCAAFIEAEKRLGEDFVGPLCAWHSVDLGIALCSAAKVASQMNVDNRMLYSVGVAARSLGLLDADVVVGIPLSVTGKNIYFDR